MTMIAPTSPDRRSLSIGILAWIATAAGVTVWQLATRWGVTTTLTSLDLALFRYGVPSLVLAPLLWRRGVIAPDRPVWLTVLIVLGAGLPFGLLVMAGAQFAPSAHMGALLPGAMPLFVAALSGAVVPAATAAGGWLLLSESIGWTTALGIALVMFGLFPLRDRWAAAALARRTDVPGKLSRDYGRELDGSRDRCDPRFMSDGSQITGGCQCGAVRYRVASLGRSSVCHCRMCQRAFGAFYAPLVIANGLEWMRGERGLFASSNISQRGFCTKCGTPLSLENFDDDQVEIATGTLDDPEQAPPTVQINHRYACSYADGIGALPEPDAEAVAGNDAWNATVVSCQKP